MPPTVRMTDVITHVALKSVRAKSSIKCWRSFFWSLFWRSLLPACANISFNCGIPVDNMDGFWSRQAASDILGNVLVGRGSWLVGFPWQIFFVWYLWVIAPAFLFLGVFQHRPFEWFICIHDGIWSWPIVLRSTCHILWGLILSRFDTEDVEFDAFLFVEREEKFRVCFQHILCDFVG